MARRFGLTGLPGRPRVLHHPHRRTPDHPPYAEMIQAAIRALAEGGGSTAAAIDCRIKSAYHDLPWAHHNLLPYYLRKLAAAGEIVITHSGRYSLDDDLCYTDAAAQPPPPPPPPMPKSSKVNNGTQSRSNSPTTQPNLLGGDDDGVVNRDLVDEPNMDVPLAMLLPDHQKCATRCEFPHLSIRLLKRKLREWNSSRSPQGLEGGRHTHAAASIGDPAGSPVVSRRGRPPKPKATIVFKDGQKEASAGHGGQQAEAKLEGISSTGDPTGSPVLKRRGRPPKHENAIILKDDQRGAGSRHKERQSEPKLSSISPLGDTVSFPVIKRRGRPPQRRCAMILQGDQCEVAAGRRDRQSEIMLVTSSSIEDPVRSPVVKRRGRPPKPKAAMILRDDQHEAAAGHEHPQSELKLVPFSFFGDPTKSTLVKRRGRPSKRKAEACHEPRPEAELPEQNTMTGSSDGRCDEKRRDADCCKEGTESVLPDHGGTREEAGFAGSDAISASEGKQPVSTRRGVVRTEGDEGHGYEGIIDRRVTRSVSANWWARPRPSTIVSGQIARNGGSTVPATDEGSYSVPKKSNSHHSPSFLQLV